MDLKYQTVLVIKKTTHAKLLLLKKETGLSLQLLTEIAFSDLIKNKKTVIKTNIDTIKNFYNTKGN